MIHFLPSPGDHAPSSDSLPSGDPRRSSGALTPFIPSASPTHRRDGWTAEKQIAFAEALAETACVAEACRRVGMSESSAYRLRRRPCGAPFRRAWDAALDHALHKLERAVLSRALHGVPRPIFYKGEQVGEYRDYDERLAMFLLRARRPHPRPRRLDGRQADGLLPRRSRPRRFRLPPARALVSTNIVNFRAASPDSRADVA